VGLEREPVGLHSATQKGGRAHQHHRGDEQIASEIPSPPHQHGGDHGQRQAEQADEDGLPERPRPAEHVVSACATSSSCSGADDAMTAESPTTIAVTPSRTESIGRLLRRPGSVSVNKRTPQEAVEETG